MSVIAYTRVSTPAQVANSSLTVQRFSLTQYAIQQGLAITKVVRDVGSAYTGVPPKLAALVITLPPHSTILVTLADRFSRNSVLGTQLLNMLAMSGHRVIATYDNQNTATPTGRAYFDQRILSAQHESEARVARTLMLSASKTTNVEESEWEEEDEETTSSDEESDPPTDTDEEMREGERDEIVAISLADRISYAQVIRRRGATASITWLYTYQDIIDHLITEGGYSLKQAESLVRRSGMRPGHYAASNHEQNQPIEALGPAAAVRPTYYYDADEQTVVRH